MRLSKVISILFAKSILNALFFYRLDVILTYVIETQRTKHHTRKNTMSETVTIKLNYLNEVVSIENNNETPNWRKASIVIGERLPMGLVSLMSQNPSRFNIVR